MQDSPTENVPASSKNDPSRKQVAAHNLLVTSGYLKGQGQRLKQFLDLKGHHVPLGHCLDAVAQLHHMKDWNTAIAVTPQQPEFLVESKLTWLQKNYGKAEVQRTPLATRPLDIYAVAACRDSSVLAIHSSYSRMDAVDWAKAGRLGIAINLFDTESVQPLNIFDHMSVSGICAILKDAFKATGFSMAEDCTELLEGCVTYLISVSQRVTLSQLLACCHHVATLPSVSDAAASPVTLTELIRNLKALRSTCPWMAHLISDAPGTVSLIAVMYQKLNCFIEVPRHIATPYEQFFNQVFARIIQEKAPSSTAHWELYAFDVIHREKYTNKTVKEALAGNLNNVTLSWLND